ncbi:MAG: integrase arm-type DNA-binding domain-containing protein [Hyphomicrobiaceae bacterium]|nr:integrase arm-type DNA-binding domain-containing protein [Hyphomicrobiaceae bacterium]
MVARTKHRLTTKTVENQKQPGLYADGGNLLLRVAPGGTKGWIFRFALKGRTRDAGLGHYPAVSLANAREEADRFRKLLAEGVDPIEARNAERATLQVQAARAITFEQCAKSYIASHEVGWKNDKHRAQWCSTLKTYVYPVIGSLPAATVDTALVMQVLEPIWSTKPETASRIRGRIEVILSWAKVRGYRDGENPAQWRGHLDRLLPAKAKVRRVVHHSALPYSKVPSFMAALREQDGFSARALEFLILTATRTGETLGATWDEIDLDGRLWTVPGARMKAGKQHRIPLPAPAIDVLFKMSEVRSSGFIFPGAKSGQPLSQMSLLMLLRRMNFAHVTVHGFRATFKTWATEHTPSFPWEVVEQALAHAMSDAVAAAYQRGDLLAKRQELMAVWGDFCKET